MLTWASPHPTAIDWQHRATANGGLTHNLHRDAASRLCKGLDSAGLTSDMVEIYPFLGDNIPAIVTKLRYVSVSKVFNTNFLAANIIAFGGLKDASNTSKQLRTDLIPATSINGKESVLFAHWYTRDTAAAGTSQVAIGATAGGIVSAGWVSTGSRESGTIAGSSNPPGSATSSPGFHCAGNVSSRATQYFLNGVATGAVSGTAGSGSFAAGGNIVLASNSASVYWKRDLLYADISTGLNAADELRQSQTVTQFQRFLNRA